MTKEKGLDHKALTLAINKFSKEGGIFSFVFQHEGGYITDSDKFIDFCEENPNFKHLKLTKSL